MFGFIKKRELNSQKNKTDQKPGKVSNPSSNWNGLSLHLKFYKWLSYLIKRMRAYPDFTQKSEGEKLRQQDVDFFR